MNIIITGATGLVGYDLVSLLLEQNHKIFAIYRSENKLVKKLKHENLIWKKIDLKNKINLKKRIDAIIHCAVVHNYSRKNNISDYINSNIISLKNLFSFAKNSKTKLIINFSTMAIYGKINVKKIDEKYIPYNPNLLGLTKQLAESILYMQPINFINLRLPGILCTRRHHSRPWLPTVIDNIKKNKNIDIHNMNGSFNNVIDTKELAKLILKLLKAKKQIRETFNFSASKPIKLKKIINAIKSNYNSKSIIRNLKSDKKSFTVSIQKIKSKLNFYPETTENIILRNL